MREHRSENNDNPNCLKKQFENKLKSLKDEINVKNNEINDLKKKNRELMKKNEKYEVENNDLKKKLEKIKQYIKNGYSTFIIEENKENNQEKNKEDISNININDEIKKKENEFSKKQKEFSKKDNNIEGYERQYLNTGSNFYPRKKIIDFININNESSGINEFQKTYEKKEDNLEVKEHNALHLKKIVPSFDYLPNSAKNKYQKHFYYTFNKK